MGFGSRFRGPLPEIGRARRVAEVLIRNGLGFLAESTGLASFLPLRLRRMGARQQVATQSVPQRLRHTLEELGPTYIKLGQVLSTRPDVVPADYIVEFSKLLDDAPPAPTAQIVAIIEQELGAPLEAIFGHFDHEPIASASIGQVHRATLLSGEDVVVKVQRPGVEETIQTDLNILLAQARFLEARSEALRGYRIVDVVEEFAQALRGEVDYTREGRQADMLRRLAAPQVIIPHVYWNLTTRRVIILEHIDGIKLSEIERLRAEGHDLAEIADRLGTLYLRDVFLNGVFHADPHPANILVCDGRIGLIDFGSVGYLSPRLREDLGDMLFALVQQDADDMVYVVTRMGAIGTEANLDGLRHEVQRLIGRYYGVPLQSVPIPQFLGDLMGSALRHRVRMPADLALLVRTVVVLEGVTRTLDPTFDLAAHIEPFARRLIRDRLSLRKTVVEGLNTVRQMESLLRVLPRRVDILLEQMERGNLTFGFEIRGLGRALQKLDAVANRLSFSVIVAALVMGSALVLAGGAELVLRIPFVNLNLPLAQIGFVMAALMGAWLVLSIIRSRGL